jgi:RimJ/RimL family protein N-acetyltransferase
MTISVLPSPDPELVLGRAGELVTADPVGHTAAAARLADAIRHREPGRYWLGLLDGVPAGVAVQQPAGAPLALTPMPAEVAAAIADAIAAADTVLPGVYGPAAAASYFAEAWAGRRGIAAVPTAEEWLYEVRDLRFPDGVAGAPRRAARADRELLLSWLPRFQDGPGWAGSNPAAIFVTRRLAAGHVWIWEDGGPVSMAARTDAVAGVVRIMAVNTPPERRGRGYASAGVAALSAKVLAQDLRCVLNANVGNAPANAVYRRLGYQVVGDVRRYRFG